MHGQYKVKSYNSCFMVEETVSAGERLRSVNMMVVCTLVSILLWRSSGRIGQMKQGEDLSLARWTTFIAHGAQSHQQQVTFAFEAEHRQM
jgi:hypothetical protein